MTRKIIVVTFGEENPEGAPFNVPEYRRAYQEFSEVCTDLGVSLYISRGQDSYIGQSTFANCWLFEGDSLLRSENAVVANVIYVKSSNTEFESGDNVINIPELKRICTDKFATYELFKEFSPATFLVDSEAELLSTIDKVTTGKVVVKPLEGSKGDGVQIKPLNQIQPPGSYPVVVQEFLDSEIGIPGIVEGIHELRIILMGGDIRMALVRTPPKGSLMANIALGGKLTVIDIDSIPEEVSEIVKEVDSVLQQYGPRVYCVDVCRTQQGYKLVELNAQPGLHSQSWSPAFKEYQKNLCNYLIKL